MTKKKNIAATMENAKTAGLEKFRKYVEPRHIYMNESTYGIRSVIHGKTKSQLEAVDAVCKGISGWVINRANRQRTFVSAQNGYTVI